jgi:hypothetical protein
MAVSSKEGSTDEKPTTGISRLLRLHDQLRTVADCPKPEFVYRRGTKGAGRGAQETEFERVSRASSCDPVPVYVWNADQDVCLAAFILEYHEVLERQHNDPLLRWIVQFNNKIDVCEGLYPVDLEEVVRNHFTWVFEPYRHQRMFGKTEGDAELVKDTIRQVLTRLEDLLLGRAGIAPITAEPEILYVSPHGFRHRR